MEGERGKVRSRRERRGGEREGPFLLFCLLNSFWFGRETERNLAKDP